MNPIITMILMPITFVKLVWSLVTLGIALGKLGYHLGRLAFIGLRNMFRLVQRTML